MTKRLFKSILPAAGCLLAAGIVSVAILSACSKDGGADTQSITITEGGQYHSCFANEVTVVQRHQEIYQCHTACKEKRHYLKPGFLNTNFGFCPLEHLVSSFQCIFKVINSGRF